MKKKRVLFLAALFLVFSFLAYKTLLAQTTNGLSVHPSNFDLNIEPGRTTTGEVFLQNLTDRDFTVAADKRNFTATGEEGQVNLTTEETTFSLVSWLSVTPSTTNLPAHETRKFTFSITPPKNAEPGGHFGSIVFRTIPSKNLKTTGAALSQEVASLLLVRIPGDVKEQASIESFTSDKNFYEEGPARFTVRVRNEGGVHIRPAGVVTLTNNFGQKDITGFEGLNILPSATRRLPITWDKHWLIGKYTAHLALAYGSQNSQLYATTEFYAFPVKLGLIVLAVLIVLFVMRKRLWKAFRVMVRGK